MTQALISNPSTNVAPMVADEVNVAQKQAAGDAWPHNPPIFGFAIGGVIMLAMAIIGRALSAIGVSNVVAITLGSVAGFAGLVAVVWVIVRAVRRRRRNKSPDLLASDMACRIRVYGPESKVQPIADQIENIAFEPVVMRSIHAVEFGKETEAGSLVTKTSRRRGLQARTSGSPDHKVHHTMFWSIAMGIIVVAGLHFLVFQFNRKNPPNYFEVMAGVALGLCISSFVRPVYIRVAPGVLDVFMFGLLGSGRPRVERYDLRTARVTVDGDRRLVRIDDASRPSARTVFVHSGRLMGGTKPRERAVLMAARSTHPTPPMPMDALE